MRIWKTVATLTFMLASSATGVLAHAGHEPAGAGALDAWFHSVFGIDAWVALAVVAVALVGWAATGGRAPAKG